MSDEPILRVRSRSSSGSGRALRLPMLILSAGIWVLALSEIGQGWEMIRLANGYEPPGRIGDLVSATLLNGQTFFGTLDNVTRTTISLRDVSLRNCRRSFRAVRSSRVRHARRSSCAARTANGPSPMRWRSRSSGSRSWKRSGSTPASRAS